MLRSTVSTKTMTWDKKSRLLSAEVSEVGGWSSEYTLVSHITGNKVLVSLVHEEHDSERELLWRDYKPTNADIRLNMTLRIFND
jgi:hypothetical protein